jgi:hypothetical protein
MDVEPPECRDAERPHDGEDEWSGPADPRRGLPKTGRDGTVGVFPTWLQENG